MIIREIQEKDNKQVESNLEQINLDVLGQILI